VQRCVHVTWIEGNKADRRGGHFLFPYQRQVSQRRFTSTVGTPARIGRNGRITRHIQHDRATTLACCGRDRRGCNDRSTLCGKEFRDSPEDRAAVLDVVSGYYDTKEEYSRAEGLLRQALDLVKSSDDADLRRKLQCAHADTLTRVGRSSRPAKMSIG
jgi:hypothetical protein